MAKDQPGIGNRIAPPRFLAFCAIALIAVPAAISFAGWSEGTMIGFDLAAGVFLVSIAALLKDSGADEMRRASARNDANRVVLLGISAVTTVAVLAAVAAELTGKGQPSPATIALVIATLVLSWTFGNTIYALHYAHLFYVKDERGEDAGGLDFPGTKEPTYWDFIYFAFTLGMTFQTSDTDIRSTQMRRIVTLHSLVAFVFNLGVIAFTINVLGGS